MTPHGEAQPTPTRRQFFEGVGLRAGGIALGLMAGESAARGGSVVSASGPDPVHPPMPGMPHFPCLENLNFEGATGNRVCPLVMVVMR